MADGCRLASERMLNTTYAKFPQALCQKLYSKNVSSHIIIAVIKIIIVVAVIIVTAVDTCKHHVLLAFTNK